MTDTQLPRGKAVIWNSHVRQALTLGREGPLLTTSAVLNQEAAAKEWVQKAGFGLFEMLMVTYRQGLY